MKKTLSIVLALILAMGILAGCGGGGSVTKPEQPDNPDIANTGEEVGDDDYLPASDIKVGFIMLHDENSTYDNNFITAAKEVCKKLEISDENCIIKTNIPEGQECYDTACDLADAGCNIIFADSFGHEDFMIQAAKEFPEVEFCHATGTKAHTEELPNYHNAFASIYEGRYLAGVAAGMKLNQMIENGDIKEDEAKIGYVGAYTYAEVISGYMPTPWALPLPVSRPVFPMFPTTVPPFQHALIPLLFLPGSTGSPIMSMLSLQLLQVKSLSLTGPEISAPVLSF